MDMLICGKDCKDTSDVILANALNHYYITKDFKKLLSYLSGKIGYGDGHVIFSFWDSMDEYDKTFYEKKFDGVEVDYLDDINIYSLGTLYYYVNIAIKRYIDIYPKDKVEMNKIIETMEVNFLV